MGWNDHLPDPNSYADRFPHLKSGLGGYRSGEADADTDRDDDAEEENQR